MNTYLITRIVRTDGTNLRYIFSDGYEETHEPDWQGFFRGTVPGRDDDGEFERRTHEWPPHTWSDVADNFVAGGGVIEDYVAPEPVPQNED